MNAHNQDSSKDPSENESPRLKSALATYAISSPIDFVLKREFINKYRFYDRPQPESAEMEFELFAQIRRPELNQMPPLALNELFERMKAEPWDVEEASIPFMRAHAKADFEQWSRCALWTVDEAVALFLGRDPITFQWNAVQPWIPNSQWFFEAAMLKRHLEHSVELGKIEARQTPLATMDWSAKHGFDFPRQLRELVDSHDTYEILSPKIHELFKSLDPRTVNSFIAIFVTMAIDGYEFDPNTRYGRSGSNIAHAMELLGPGSLGSKSSLTPNTIIDILREFVLAFGTTNNPTKYIEEKRKAKETSAGAQRARRRKAKSDKIGG